MRLLHRASPWRELFANPFPPDTAGWPALLDPLRDALEALGPAPTLAAARHWQSELVEALVRLDLPAWRISQLISDHNDWLYRRAIDLSRDEMEARGWGTPPVAWCVLTLGSAARHESLLGPDQDNAMILSDYPDCRHVEIDGYFQALGERFTARLDEAGIPLCNGHVMARWPMWRKRLSEWREQLTLWSADRRVKRVQQANILLDFHPVHGDVSLAEALTEHVTRCLPRAPLFLDEMGELLREQPLALDRFGRLAGTAEGAPHDRAIDLKRQGMLPLVGAVRLLALRHGLTPPDTRSRLTALVMRDVMTVDQARSLTAAMERLQEVMLGEQRATLAEGRAPDGWVDMARLGVDQQQLLRRDLQQIRHFIKSL